VYACKVAGADGWAGMRVGARRVRAGPNAPGRARRRALPGFGGLRAADGFGSSARFGDALGERVAVARKQYAGGDRKQGIQRSAPASARARSANPAWSGWAVMAGSASRMA
jgi:hypothetical protein